MADALVASAVLVGRKLLSSLAHEIASATSRPELVYFPSVGK